MTTSAFVAIPMDALISSWSFRLTESGLKAARSTEDPPGITSALLLNAPVSPKSRSASCVISKMSRSLSVADRRYSNLANERRRTRRRPPGAKEYPRPVTPPKTIGTPASLAAMAPYTLGLIVKCWARHPASDAGKSARDLTRDLTSDMGLTLLRSRRPWDELRAQTLDLGHGLSGRRYGVHADPRFQEPSDNGGAEMVEPVGRVGHDCD